MAAAVPIAAPDPCNAVLMRQRPWRPSHIPQCDSASIPYPAAAHTVLAPVVTAPPGAPQPTPAYAPPVPAPYYPPPGAPAYGYHHPPPGAPPPQYYPPPGSYAPPYGYAPPVAPPGANKTSTCHCGTQSMAHSETRRRAHASNTE